MIDELIRFERATARPLNSVEWCDVVLDGDGRRIIARIYIYIYSATEIESGPRQYTYLATNIAVPSIGLKFWL